MRQRASVGAPNDVTHLSLPAASSASEGAPRASLRLDTLFREHSAYVSRVAFRILGQPQDVDDVVQDVFLKASKRLHAIRDPGAVRAWLATITVRVARRRIRRRRVRFFFGLEAVPEEAAGPDAEHHAMLRDVRRVLDSLPANLRIAWVLRYVEDEPLEQIAAYCSVSRATAHRWVVRAHTALQEAFRD
ncbi:MAG: RNA polymerase sigma factor [Myxococcota bacterium]